MIASFSAKRREEMQHGVNVSQVGHVVNLRRFCGQQCSRDDGK